MAVFIDRRSEISGHVVFVMRDALIWRTDGAGHLYQPVERVVIVIGDAAERVSHDVDQAVTRVTERRDQIVATADRADDLRHGKRVAVDRIDHGQCLPAQLVRHAGFLTEYSVVSKCLAARRSRGICARCDGKRRDFRRRDLQGVGLCEGGIAVDDQDIVADSRQYHILADADHDRCQQPVSGVVQVGSRVECRGCGLDRNHLICQTVEMEDVGFHSL